MIDLFFVYLFDCLFVCLFQFLAEVYKNDGLLAATEVCYRQALQRESSNQAVVLLRLAHVALITNKVQ